MTCQTTLKTPYLVFFFSSCPSAQSILHTFTRSSLKRRIKIVSLLFYTLQWLSTQFSSGDWALRSPSNTMRDFYSLYLLTRETGYWAGGAFALVIQIKSGGKYYRQREHQMPQFKVRYKFGV